MVLKRTLGATRGEGGKTLRLGGGIEETTHRCCIKQMMKWEAGESEGGGGGKGNSAEEVTGCRRSEGRDGKDRGEKKQGDWQKKRERGGWRLGGVGVKVSVHKSMNQ